MGPIEWCKQLFSPKIDLDVSSPPPKTSSGHRVPAMPDVSVTDAAARQHDDDLGRDEFGHPDTLREKGLKVLEVLTKDILAKSQTGSVLLKGASPEQLRKIGDWIDPTFKTLGMCYFTHAVIIVRNPPLEVLRAYECTAHESGCYGFESTRCGVRLLPLVDIFGGWLDVYKLEDDEEEHMIIMVRNVTTSLGKKLNYRKFYQFMIDTDGTKYGIGLNDIFEGLTRFLLAGIQLGQNDMQSAGEDLTNYFCVELVAESLQRLGVLDGDTDSNSYIPADLVPSGNAEKHLIKGVKLGPAQWVRHIPRDVEPKPFVWSKDIRDERFVFLFA